MPLAFRARCANILVVDLNVGLVTLGKGRIERKVFLVVRGRRGGSSIDLTTAEIRDHLPISELISRLEEVEELESRFVMLR